MNLVSLSKDKQMNNARLYTTPSSTKSSRSSSMPPTADITELETKIDNIVNELYGIIKNNEMRSSGEQDAY